MSTMSWHNKVSTMSWHLSIRRWERHYGETARGVISDFELRIADFEFDKGRCWALGADIAKVNEQN